jgi:hypothetical protein
MKRILVFVTVFVLVLSATSRAQKEAVAKASETENLAMLTVSNPLFEGMCKSFAKRLAVPKGERILVIEPKPEEDSEQSIGDVWIVSNMTREIEVQYSELPHMFTGLRGPNAKKVVGMVCYLENEEYYSRKHLSIIANIADLKAIAQAFR